MVESEGSVLTFNFEVEGDIPEGGLPVSLDIDADNLLWITDFNNFSRTGLDEESGLFDSLFILRNPTGLGGEISSFSGSLLLRDILEPFDSFPLILTENQASFEINVFDDFYAEENEILGFSVGEGEGYTVAGDPVTVTIQDGPDGIINPADAPVVGITLDAPIVLVEDDPIANTLTLTLTTTGDIPEGGIPILLESEVLDVIGDFDAGALVTTGIADGRFGGVAPVELGRGFAAVITEAVATITVPVNNDNAIEGLETLTFNLVNGEGYNVDANAASASILIADPPGNVIEGGTDGADRLIGTNRNDTISAFAGSDVVNGGDGNDNIDGGDGADRLNGGNGIDIIDGGNGRDRINGGAGNDSLSGGNGDDVIIGGDGFDTIDGGSGNDVIRAGEDRSEIFGGSGDDRIFSGENDSTVDGGSGNDLIRTGVFSDDIVFGGTGNDRIFLNGDDDIASGDAGNDRIFGGADEDSIFGGLGNDFINGGSENDLLSGDEGDDRILGGDGDDLLMGVTGNDRLTGGAGIDTFVFGNGDGTDVITDFENGIDKIGLVNGELVFDDLSIISLGSRIAIDVTATGERLALLNNAQNVTLTETDFVGIDDISSIDAVLG
ncbi:MAG: calcium-binding protein [Cyanobacteria bacterium P01_F01_bin.3]